MQFSTFTQDFQAVVCVLFIDQHFLTVTYGPHNAMQYILDLTQLVKNPGQSIKCKFVAYILKIK